MRRPGASSSPTRRSIDATQYRRQELVGLDARKLFAGGPENTAGIPTQPAQPCLNRLVRHDQSQVAVRLSTAPLKHKQNFNLLFIEPAEMLPDSPDQAGLSPFWDSLIKLFSNDDDENLFAALTRALAAARSLSGADVLVVYRLVEKETLIPHLVSDGDFPSVARLPECTGPGLSEPRHAVGDRQTPGLPALPGCPGGWAFTTWPPRRSGRRTPSAGWWCWAA